VIVNLLLAQGVPGSVDQMIRSLPGDNYFNLAKIIVMLLAVFVWAFPASWVRRDVARLNLPQFLWGVVVMTSAVVGWLLWFSVPIFMVGLAIYLVVAMGSILVYVFYRDSLVTPEDRIISTQNTIERIRSEKKTTSVVAAEVKIHLSTPTGQEIGIPKNEQQRVDFQQFQDLMFDAFWRRASDAYVRPAGPSVRIAFRIDGVLNEYRTVDRQSGDRLVGYIKSIAGMDVTQRRLPQTGKLVAQQLKAKQRVRLDLETSGTTAGEKLTIRIRAQEARYTIDDLGFTEQQLEQIRPTLDVGKGIILICGMSDCGASTTLYGIGRTHDAFTRNIHTMETKPLMELDNITQNIFRSGTDADFARQLRSVFGCNPDIVLVDPCPDPETAKLIGQMVTRNNAKVYMTMRASSSFSGLARFAKWVEAPALVDTLLLIAFQRLVRKLCPACREAYNPNPQVLRKMNLSIGQGAVFYRPPAQQRVDRKGSTITCPTCQGTGYLGRMAIMEVLPVTDEVRKAITGTSAADIKAAARKSGMKYWQEIAIQKVTEGITSMQEVVRVSKQDSDGTK